jgi:signal-transduction protein with cAMP-binding, CBS, and nucleotidyltransferase domain
MIHTIGQLLEAKGKDIWSISPHVTVFEALRIMAKKDIGALLVIDQEKLVGIFSERDYVQKVILKGKSSKFEENQCGRIDDHGRILHRSQKYATRMYGGNDSQSHPPYART